MRFANFAVIACAAAAGAQSGRVVSLDLPPVPGQTVRIHLSYPVHGQWNFFALMASSPATPGTSVCHVPGWSLVGRYRLNPTTAFPIVIGQLNASGTLVHPIVVPNHATLTGLTIDLQTIDWSTNAQSAWYSDNEVLAALQAQSWRPHTTMAHTARDHRPRVAVSPTGGAIIVWVDASGRFAASRGGPGIGWSAAILGPTAAGLGDYDIGVDPAGNLTLVWAASRTIWKSRVDVAATSWSTTAPLSRLGGADDPRVAVDAAGHALAVWWQEDQPYTGVTSILAARFTAGQGWSQPAPIENNNQNLRYDMYPDIAMDNAGNATVVWTNTSSQNSIVMANRYTVGSGWGLAMPVTNASGRIIIEPAKVAVDDSGNAVSIWSSRPNNDFTYDIHAAPYSNGAWGAATRLDSLAAETSASEPQALMIGAGNAIAVWTEMDIVPKLMTATLQNGTWGPTTTAVAPAGVQGTAARNPECAIDSTGRVTVLYANTAGGSPPAAFLAQYLPGTGWLSPYRIDDNNHDGYRGGTIGVDSAGNVIVAMQESWTGNDNKIVVREFR